MIRSRIGAIGALLLAALATQACAARATRSAASGAAADSTAELEAIYRARQRSARTRFTAADVRFMTAMIGHHAQALEMAGLVPTRSATPAVRTLAARIINAQRDEIASMQRWLRDRGQPVPEVDAAGSVTGGHGAHHDGHMPGMLTHAQLQALERARGVEFDRLFLRYMIQHHRGAVAMVRELFATDGAGQDEEVFKFASDVQVDQDTEIARMQRMLEELPGGGPER